MTPGGASPSSRQATPRRASGQSGPKPPEAPLPFWRWGWRSASVETRVFFCYRAVVRPLLAVAAIVGAAIVVFDAVGNLRHTVQWRNGEYARVTSIHAGYNFAFVESKLGFPTETRALGRTGFVERIFQRRDSFEQVVTDPTNRVVLYSVTSCSPQFQPTFEPGPGTEVRLQDHRLSDLPTGSSKTVEAFMFTDKEVTLGYTGGDTVSTPETFWEWTGPASNATDARSYFIGLNPLCLSRDQEEEAFQSSPTVPDVFQGSPRKAPKLVTDVRNAFAANTYAETVDPLTPITAPLNQVVVAKSIPDQLACSTTGADPKGRCSTVTIGAFVIDLPPGLANQGSTRKPSSD